MQRIDSFKCLVAGSLSLAEPWHIEGIEIDAEKMQVHIYVGIRAGARLACPECGCEATVRNGYEPDERVWRLRRCTYFARRLRIAHRPRARCPLCGTKLGLSSFRAQEQPLCPAVRRIATLLLADTPRAKAARL